MKPVYGLVLGAAAIALLAFVPKVADGYQLALGISLLYFTVLATAWALFSGPTHYISLATVAFFGIGAYTVAVLGEKMPWPAVLGIAALIGVAVALVVGLSTLRLSGIYFVIFTFGLSELIRQLVSWYEINISRSVGRYIFLSITTEQIYWQLLALVALVLLTGWLIGRSRLGLALRVIGNDEVVARHSGIDTTGAKLTMFAVSALFMTLTGAVMAPRWTYLDPAIAFSPMLSFEVVIMALLGGAGSLFGPLLGAVPLVLLFEVLTAKFPTYFSILLGVVFIVIVYMLPRGVIGLLPSRPPEIPDAPASAQPAAIATAARRAARSLRAAQDLRRSRRGRRSVVLGQTRRDRRPDRPERLGQDHRAQSHLGRAVRRCRCDPFQGPRSHAHRHPPHRAPWTGAHVPARARARIHDRDRERHARPRFPRDAAHRRQGAVRRARAARARRPRRQGCAPRRRSSPTSTRSGSSLPARSRLNPTCCCLTSGSRDLNPTELGQGIALIRSLRESGITIILVEHVMDAIRSLCDRCIVMNVGRKIAEGPPAAVLAEKEVVRAYLGGGDA